MPGPLQIANSQQNSAPGQDAGGVDQLSAAQALLDVRGLCTHFHTRRGVVRAVDGVSFRLNPNETLGLVGESGCGKSVTCYSILGLVPRPPARIEAERLSFDGLDLLRCPPDELRAVRGGRISMIFQNPMTSLNPYLRIGAQLVEPLRLHRGLGRQEARDCAVDALTEVGIQDAPQRLEAYPQEFSGGMRQRVMIAMALITEPEILIADEPTTALDVTVQAQILELIKERQAAVGSAILFITHDLGVVAGFCDRVMVMYAGRIVEAGPTRELYYSPKHPYTVALQKSIPALHRKGEPLYTIPGAPPDLHRPFQGCPFAPRCEFAARACAGETVLREIAPGHLSACVRCQNGELDL